MIPIQFEYMDVTHVFGYPMDIRKFVVVVDTFKHHYSDSMMYRARVDYLHPLTDVPVTEYLTLTEAMMLDMLKTRVTN